MAGSNETAVPQEVRLVFACSGGGDVGEIADRAARMLNREGTARMFCLGGIGGRVGEVVSVAQSAARILAIDGCQLDCAKKCLELAGLANVRHLRVTDHQMEKGKTPVNVHNVTAVVGWAKHALLGP